MARPTFHVRASALFGCLVAAALALPAAPAAAATGGDEQEANYLVVVDPAKVSTAAAPGVLAANGFRVDARASQKVSKLGIVAGRTTRGNAKRLRSLPGVQVGANRRVQSMGEPVAVQAAPASPKPIQVAPAQEQPGCASTERSCPLQWDLDRIHVPDAWKVTQGSPEVKVLVLDTGLTSKHEEVGPNYDLAESVSFVEPNVICPEDDQDFLSPEDFNGHGTWTATHVAGRNGPLMTGIAPNTTLVNGRVLGKCGFGLDAWVLNGMMYAADIGARVVSMSLGGYICRDGIIPGSSYCDPSTLRECTDDPTLDPEFEPATWNAYVRVVNYLKSAGTVVVAAAGNEHVRLGADGRVASHGSLAFASTNRGDRCNDLTGLSEVPGGAPGVVAVAATNRVTAQGAPGETLWGQYGVGRQDQLTYFSSYGPKIDVSAPGGARNYNVPSFDCLSDNCRRLGESTPGAADNPGDFGAWGVTVGTHDPCADCYTFVQGTSMATPQVAGAAALTLAVGPKLAADELIAHLRASVTPWRDINLTPPIAEDPASRWYLYDVDYRIPAVRNSEMGTGVIDAAVAVNAAGGGGAAANRALRPGARQPQ